MVSLLVQPADATSGCGDIRCNCIVAILTLKSYSGSIEYSGSVAYEDAVDIDNKRVTKDPLLVLGPANEADVSAAILAASTCNATMSVLSGGH